MRLKIFTIKSDHTQDKVLAYLLYYEKAKQFYIELPPDADEWDTPLILSSFAKRGHKTINAYWSNAWVQQRIIPSDRQNITEILKANNLDSYDEYKLLILANGRCAQDDYYIEQIEWEKLPDDIQSRFLIRVEEVVALGENDLLIFFRNGTTKKCNMNQICTETRFQAILRSESLFSAARVQTDGYGITWGENLDVGADILYESGKDLPISIDAFHRFAADRITDTTGACRILNCSRQNISDLIRRGKLHPLRSSTSSYLFLIAELQQRQWQ